MSGKMTSNDFYCIRCGNKGIPLSRKRGFQRGKFHRKKLYCIHCMMEVNHVECKTPEEVEQFKRDFAAGKFAEEAEESVNFLQRKG